MYQIRKKTQKGIRQAYPDRTGIPSDIKEKYEAISGLSFDDVRVHYNSAAPAQMQAFAYTRGNDVYIAPGQERRLEHELGHVVQQKRGLVRPDSYLQGIPVNTDQRLETEASQMSHRVPGRALSEGASSADSVVQRSPIDWEAIMELLKSGKGIGYIAFTFGLTAYAAYRLVQDCLSREGGSLDETIVAEAKTKAGANKSGTQKKKSKTGANTSLANKGKSKTKNVPVEKGISKQDMHEVKDKKSVTNGEPNSSNWKHVGDCLYDAVAEASGQQGDTPDLYRRITAEYAIGQWENNHNQQVFQQVTDINELVKTIAAPRAWNTNGGDLAPYFLAHALGIHLVIHVGDNIYEFNNQGGPRVELRLSGEHYTVYQPSGFGQTAANTSELREGAPVAVPNVSGSEEELRKRQEELGKRREELNAQIDGLSFKSNDLTRKQKKINHLDPQSINKKDLDELQELLENNPIPKEKKKTRGKIQPRADGQTSRAEVQKDPRDQKAEEVFGEGMESGLLPEKEYPKTKASQNGCIYQLLVKKGIIAEGETIHFVHKSGKCKDSKPFYVRIRDRCYKIFDAQHVANSNKDYKIVNSYLKELKLSGRIYFGERGMLKKNDGSDF